MSGQGWLELDTSLLRKSSELARQGYGITRHEDAGGITLDVWKMSHQICPELMIQSQLQPIFDQVNRDAQV